MIYRSFKDLKLSQLGFGCMRFASDPSTGEIDQAKVNAMFDLAIREGVNYFDTAYPYLGGKSELAMAEGLSRYPRESYYIADKFPGHSLTAPIDNIALFKVSLRKCRTDYFDFYLLHNITEWSVKYYESEEYHILPDMLRTFREEWPLTSQERSVLLEIAENLKKGVPCTACRYCCDGCPVGLDIPYLLQCYNDYKFAQSLPPSMRIDALEEEKRPAACIGCGQCMHACPQGIDVPAALAELAEMYEKGPHWSEQVKLRQKIIQEDLGEK